MCVCDSGALLSQFAGPYQDWTRIELTQREKDIVWPSHFNHLDSFSLLYSVMNNSTSASRKSAESCFFASQFHWGCFTVAVWFLHWPWGRPSIWGKLLLMQVLDFADWKLKRCREHEDHANQLCYRDERDLYYFQKSSSHVIRNLLAVLRFNTGFDGRF